MHRMRSFRLTNANLQIQPMERDAGDLGRGTGSVEFGYSKAPLHGSINSGPLWMPLRRSRLHLLRTFNQSAWVRVLTDMKLGGRMAVKRIVANIATDHVVDAKAFYTDILGLNLVMDHGWILTFAAREAAAPQISIATEGGSGTPVPDLSIEVDNLDEVHQRVLAAGSSIEYGPTSEPWGLRRFYVRDPFGRLLNILAHES
jgi:catechol 2,3-dioxygenase-like lactoylglutathione lyase family enzyme